ncbi:ABC transporter substrate-binding protein [Falsirhodobacter xinxiangensis]|uniref:ABC transporter substrate-binding protein n=1 Tax=Falsirhodobacter xinxiangensis TaxID=2530049 RepID=UPI0010AAC498|nr:ABC transporter substrate-binding protein [Rhodobacter xinxiangensis]
MPRRRDLLKLFPAAALLAVGGRAFAAPAKGGTITFGIESEPTTLNPHLNGQAKARVILRNLYDTLLARDAQGGFVPWLAEGYEVSSDGLVYDFTLRPGIRFHDGVPLDAAALAATFEAVRDVAYAPSLAEGPAAAIAAVEATGPLVLRITLSRPYAPFLGFAAGLEILSPAAYASDQLKAGGPAVAGTGPFILDAYAKGQEIRLRRNPDYQWAPADAAHQGPALLEGATFRFLGESAVRIGALSSGQVDVIEGISGNDVSLFRDVPGFSYARALNTGTPYTLFLNAQHGPTADLAVRKALFAALDIDGVLASVYRGERQRAWGISGPTEADFYDASIERSFAFDPAEANRLLDGAGWTARDADGFRTKDGKRLSIEVVQSQATVRDQRDVLLLALQAQARQNAGILLDLQYVDLGTYSARRKGGDYGSIPNSRTPANDGLDIEYHYLPIDRGGSINYARINDPEVVEWLAAAAATQDTATRKALYAQVQDLAIRQKAYALPLYVPEDQIAAGAHVQGLGFRPYLAQPDSLHSVWLDEGARI